MKVHEAKTHLSRLLAEVEQGEEILIERGDRPVARLVGLDSHYPRELGFLSLHISDDFDAPLPAEELSRWER